MYRQSLFVMQHFWGKQLNSLMAWSPRPVFHVSCNKLLKGPAVNMDVRRIDARFELKTVLSSWNSALFWLFYNISRTLTAPADCVIQFTSFCALYNFEVIFKEFKYSSLELTTNFRAIFLNIYLLGVAFKFFICCRRRFMHNVNYNSIM